MPTTSRLSQFTFTNYGPLTTTFTPPASCQSEEKYVQIASIYSAHLGEWLADCSLTYGDCLPSGTVTPASGPSNTDNPLAAFEVPYFSPGLECPLDWTTVGTAWRMGDRVTTSGVFEAEAHTIYRWPVDVLPSILSPGETAVLCCPSSMTGGKNGICYSTLPIYELTTGCQRYLPPDAYTLATTSYGLDGATTYGALISITDSPPSITSTTTFASTDTTTLTGVSVMAMVTLIHTEGDRAGGLSTGASAGIGVGVGVGVLGIIAAVAYFLWRRKRMGPSHGAEDHPMETAAVGIPATGHELDAQKPRGELDSFSPQGELGGTELRHYAGAELDVSQPRLELSAERRYELSA
ncbi:hypothetical protein BJX65DRAFT_311113 [Aspergillus insuetus]